MLKSMREIFLAAAVLAFAVAADCRAEGSGGTNAAEHVDAPYVILVSIDGFRHDFQARFDTPALDRISASGVRANALRPVYPTLTFPNHYSIATGLYPANHGIVDNTFYDRDRKRRFALDDRNSVQDGSWYGGNPLWVVAEKNGMVSAAYYFVGTEADIQGIRPTYWKPFNASVAGSERVAQVLDWLALPESERPHLVTLYFEDIDVTTHRDGVSSPTVADAVMRVDARVAELLAGIDALGLFDDTFVFVVSDHGLADYRRAPPFVLEDVIDLSGIRTVEHGSSVSLYFDAPDRARALSISTAINDRWRRGQAIIPGEAPLAWHVDAGSRFADVIVQADARASVVSSRGRSRSAADHGWPPAFQDMHGIFLAMGPRLPAGRRIPAFDNVDIYPMILEVLGLPADGPIDGDPATLLPLLDAE